MSAFVLPLALGRAAGSARSRRLTGPVRMGWPIDLTGLRSFVGVVLAALAVTLSTAGGAYAAETGSSFGVASYSLHASSMQAGEHADVTTEFKLNTNASGEPVGQLKDAQVELPAGFVGNPLAVPRCSQLEFESLSCKGSAQVGTTTLSLYLGGSLELGPLPLYNITPSPGHLATFAVFLLVAKIEFQVDLSSDGSYALTTSLHDLTTDLPLVGALSVVGAGLTLWGVPASPAHDLERDPGELTAPKPIYGPPNEQGEREIIGREPTPAGVAAEPFLTNPTDCSVPSLTSTVSVDSWENPGEPVTRTATLPAPSGCEQLQISPRISVAPDTTQRDTPAGYDIDLSDPLNEEPYRPGTPALQGVTLTLPPGTSLSPGVANGLEGCGEAQFAAEECPNASKVGTVTVNTPFLADHLTGAVYLATPTPAATFRLLLSVAADSVRIHMSAVVQPDPSTGQLTVSFAATPPLPFSELDMHLFGGPGAVLSNPADCGVAPSTAQFSAYGGPTASSSSSFTVDADGAGGACPGALPFSPSVSAGTVSSLAGGSSPFSLTVSREDGQGDLSTIATRLPAGLLGMLAQVPRCAEALAAAGVCPQASQIGTTTIAAGAGSQPLSLTGSVYLTGPYKGAPFGLAIVTPVLAGPFDLGTIAVRAQIQVDPHTLQLGIVSDPLPSIVDGIPLRIRVVNLTMNRPGFMLAPTDCATQTIASTLGSSEGATATVSTPFQVVGCSGLGFAPKLTVTSQALASRGAEGASLEVKVVPGSGQANIRSVAVQLPVQLRPRLSTIRDACLAGTFAANPGACPAAAQIGTVTIGTPILAAPLSGAAYLVYRGGTAFPEFAMVPQGEGVSADLFGELKISRSDAISASVSGLPDVPIDSFVLRLPRGPHSMLGATGGLCSKKLGVPYTLTGQNGAQLKHTVTVSVGGCPKARAVRKAKKASSKRA